MFFVCPQECRCHTWGEWTALGCKRKADSGSDAAVPGGRETVHGQEALLVDSAQIVGCVTIGYPHTVKSVPSLDTWETVLRTWQCCFCGFCTPTPLWSVFLLNTGSILPGDFSSSLCVCQGGQRMIQEQSAGQRAPGECTPSLSLCLCSWWGWEPPGRPTPRGGVSQRQP